MNPITAGLPYFIINDLFIAISSIVFPKVSWWSNPIDVIMLRIGSQILTASNLPPNPPSAIYF